VEGEVLNGRCLFCHPLEKGEGTKDGKIGDLSKASAGPKGNSFNFDQSMITPQQQNRCTPMQTTQTPGPTPIQSRFTPTGLCQGQQASKHHRKHSWKEHIKMSVGKDGTEAPDGDDACSQYSRTSQVSDGMGRLGKAMATGLGMSCAETINYHNQKKSPHTQRRSPKTRDPPSSSHTTPVSHSSGNISSSNNNSPLGGSDRGVERDVPAHVRLAHNKLPSSVYHHHLYPMSKETEQAYIEKTLAYLESGGGDVVDVIAAMRRFPFSLPVQSLCCEKLYVHCFDDGHAHAIMLVGGVRTVIDAMEHHSKDVALQRGCAGVIKHMATSSKYNLDMLDKLGALRVIVNAMEMHSTCAPLLESCCWALGSMAKGSNPDVRVRVANAGGVRLAMNAVEQFPQNESLLRAAFHCLQQLGYNPSSYVAALQQLNQSQQLQDQNMQAQQMQRQQHLQQLEKVISQTGGNTQMNQNQQQQIQRLKNQNSELQQMMNQVNDQTSDMQQMMMNHAQQQQFQRMMSRSNDIRMQMPQSQQQQQLLNRQRQQQQMLAMSQAGGRSNDEIMNNQMMANMRMNMMGNMGNSQSLMGNNDGMSNLRQDGNNSMTGNNSSNRRRM
jgi:hypothetical protein